MQFPFFKTKISGPKKKFNLNNPEEREEYFNFKAGKEIRKLREYFKKGNTFVVYLLGKKNSGKGTYSKMFSEIVAPDSIDHFSIGDMIRGIDDQLKDKKKKKELIIFLEKNYRGWLSKEQLISSLEKRDTKTLLPTELILALVKREMGKRKKKTIFIDGFPRDLDQINFALFFRDLVGYRDDPDFFVLIDVPESIIDERIKYRVVCPACQTSRNLKLLPTSKIGYTLKKFKEDKSSFHLSPSGENSIKEFYLLCDNPKCKELKMIGKEGDSAGIKPLKERLKKDEKLINQAISLYGIPKVLLRNSVPKKLASSLVDDYEITPEYYYQWDKKEKKVIVKEKPWVILDAQGQISYSLLPPPVVVSLIKQITDILNL